MLSANYPVYSECFLEKMWRIVPDLVSWPEAWKALKAGKRVKVDDVVYYAQNTKLLGTNKMRLCLYYRDPENHYNETCMGRRIPLEWLDRNDFEVLDG